MYCFLELGWSPTARCRPPLARQVQPSPPLWPHCELQSSSLPFLVTKKQMFESRARDGLTNRVALHLSLYHETLQQHSPRSFVHWQVVTRLIVLLVSWQVRNHSAGSLLLAVDANVCAAHISRPQELLSWIGTSEGSLSISPEPRGTHAIGSRL